MNLRKIRKHVLIIVSLIAFSYYIFNSSTNYINNNTCKDWDKGFKGVTIDNSKACKIYKPETCYTNIFSMILDYSFLLGDSCDIHRNGEISSFKDVSVFKKGVPLIIGYPKTENYDFLYRGNDKNFPSTVLSKLEGVSSEKYEEIISSGKVEKYEIFVDFRDSLNKVENKTDFILPNGNIDIELMKIYNVELQGEIKIHLNKNEQVAQNRSSISNNDHNVKAKNILFFFIDSVSRNHFKRKLPKTYSWFEKYYSKHKDSYIYNNKKDTFHEYESFQFFKYHGTGTWTTVNMLPALWGIAFDSYDRKNKYFISEFKRRGYVTANISTHCAREMIDLDSWLGFVDFDNFDHEYASINCDINFYKSESLWFGPYSYRKKCLYGKSTTSYALEYSRQFLEAYKNNSKLLRIDIINNHEGTGESIKYDDDIIFEFMEDYRKNGHMKDSIIYMVSDHNFNREGFYDKYEINDWKYELTLPFLSVVIDKNSKYIDYNKIRENLKHNENLLVTPYDFHKSLLSILNEKYNVENRVIRGSSFFDEKFENEYDKRNCTTFDIPKKTKKNWCRCDEEETK